MYSLYIYIFTFTWRIYSSQPTSHSHCSASIFLLLCLLKLGSMQRLARQPRAFHAVPPDPHAAHVRMLRHHTPGTRLRARRRLRLCGGLAWSKLRGNALLCHEKSCMSMKHISAPQHQHTSLRPRTTTVKTARQPQYWCHRYSAQQEPSLRQFTHSQIIARSLSTSSSDISIPATARSSRMCVSSVVPDSGVTPSAIASR
jgi:hypothetical protein